MMLRCKMSRRNSNSQEGSSQSFLLWAVIICGIYILLTSSPTESRVGNHDAMEMFGIEWYSGDPWVEVNDNTPYFDVDFEEVFEEYSPLDEDGRCGVAFASVCEEIMPTEERGDISNIKPTGWHSSKYDIVSGKYLYNRCHLIGYQLAGENDNELNLITGTRYLNIDGMLDFENEIAEYVEATGNTVLYRVTPIFTDNNQLADGVLMEAYSVEDNGEGIQFCVFAYNVQPGIGIDYLTGESWEEGISPADSVEGNGILDKLGLESIF